MSNLQSWSEALHLGGEDEALRASVMRHVRDAVREAGYVSRGRITSGLKEAFGPLNIDEKEFRTAIDEAIDLLLWSGDIGELATGAGRGYSPTPPRRVSWGGPQEVVLGSVDVSSGDVVRRMSVQAAAALEVVATTLEDEIGRPHWREALVELGGEDLLHGNATALSMYANELTTSGERYTLDEPNSLSVLSGLSEFFGYPDGPTGRWTRATNEGIYPAVISSGYAKRYVMLAIRDGDATLWEPPTLDMWRWIVVGATLCCGQPTWRYDRDTEILNFLVPPPRQVERAALLAGEQVSAWSWRIDPLAHSVVAGLLGSPRN